jgi:hypothetical protein
MEIEACNDNGVLIMVICSICAGPCEPHAAGVEPVCITCFYGAGNDNDNPSPRGDQSRPAPGP